MLGHVLAAAFILVFVLSVGAGLFEALRGHHIIQPPIRPAPPPRRAATEPPIRRSQIRMGTSEIEILQYENFDLIKTSDQVDPTSRW